MAKKINPEVKNLVINTLDFLIDEKLLDAMEDEEVDLDAISDADLEDKMIDDCLKDPDVREKLKAVITGVYAFIEHRKGFDEDGEDD